MFLLLRPWLIGNKSLLCRYCKYLCPLTFFPLVSVLLSHLMNLFAVPDSPDLVSVEVDAEEAVLGAQDHPVFVDETGRQRGRVLDHADRVVEHLAAPEDGSVWKRKQF